MQVILTEEEYLKLKGTDAGSVKKVDVMLALQELEQDLRRFVESNLNYGNNIAQNKNGKSHFRNSQKKYESHWRKWICKVWKRYLC